MATIGGPENLVAALRTRIMDRLSRYRPNDPALREATLRIGLMLEAQAKINIRNNRQVDGGGLLNSIRHQIYSDGNTTTVEVGSYGLRYAAINEFGGPFTDRMRKAMFANLRKQGKLGPLPRSKGIIIANNYRARPFLQPALTKHRTRITEILRQVFR